MTGWLTLLACGPLADGAYLGEPLLTLSGTVFTEGLDPAYADTPITVSVLWTGSSGDDAPSAVVTTAFPARYTLELYTAPTVDEPLPLFGTDDLVGAVGAPLITVDHDGDGRWQRDTEPVIGGSYRTVIVYSDAFPRWLVSDDTERSLVAVDVGLGCPGGAALADGSAADLYVGTLEPILADVDCDGAADEWTDVDDAGDGCPPDDVIDRECAQLASNLTGGVSAAECDRLRDEFQTGVAWTECLATQCADDIARVVDGDCT